MSSQVKHYSNTTKDRNRLAYFFEMPDGRWNQPNKFKKEASIMQLKGMCTSYSVQFNLVKSEEIYI